MAKTKTPSDKCPSCVSSRIMEPREMRNDGKLWCHCYACGYEWEVRVLKIKTIVKKMYKSRLTWKD